MERIIIDIKGVYAKEKADVIQQRIKELIEHENIIGVNIYTEKELKIFPLEEWKEGHYGNK